MKLVRHIFRHIYSYGVSCLTAIAVACPIQIVQAATALNGNKVVLTQAEIKTLNVDTLVELLNRIPGVSATESSISMQGTTSKHVQVLLDGRPLNNPVTGLVDLSGISSERLSRLTVIKGSGAVQYGNNTSGGVVLITTGSTAHKNTKKIELQYGTYNTSELSAELATTIGDTGLEMSLKRDSSDGHRLNGDDTYKSAALAFSTTLFSAIDTRLALNIASKESGYSGKITNPTPRARNRKDDTGAVLTAKYKNLTSKTYYNTFDNKYEDPDKGLDNGLDISVLGQEFRYNGPTSFGLEYEQQTADSTDFGEYKEDRVSAFLIKQFQLFGSTDKKLTAGLRVNDHSVFDKSYNPQLGFSFKRDQFDMALELNQSSNTPSFKQRYYESTYTKPNPGLGMEQATNFKLNMAYVASEDLALSLSGFYSKIDGTIAYISNGDGTYSYQNIATSTRRGIDMGANWQINPALKLNASYLYLQFIDDSTGMDLPFKPRHKAKIDIDSKLGKTSVTLTGNYVADCYDDKQNTIVQAGRFTADAKVSYPLGNTKLLLSVENLFDKEYETHVGYPAAGRTFMAGFRHQF